MSKSKNLQESHTPSLSAAPVKLVIWDLDDTYWRGTLSEGLVEPIPFNRDLIRVLNKRGIVNSICSKNDFDAAKSRLESDGDWDEFVFTSIDWNPKGERVASIIKNMGLRAVNVLFVDDNVGNLREAEHYAPGIQTLDPSELEAVVDSPALAGKNDNARSRLNQYRVLEAKYVDKQTMGVSNEEFLRSSGIRVGIHSGCREESDRLLELINRSNQLNYTKTRFTKEEFESLLADPSVTSRYVTVRDNYGDHGVCGFFAHSEDRVVNFSFSCRILNMGVERWIYQRLGSLAVTVVGDVATDLDAAGEVDWIELDDGVEVNSAAATQRAAPRGRVLLKGGCDLSVVAEHLGGGIESEFTFSSTTGALVHQEHTEILRRAIPETLEKYGDVIDRLPFLERAAYKSAIVDSPESFDTIVYSVLMDYTQGLYRYLDTDLVIPFGEFSADVTDPVVRDSYIERLGKVGLDLEFFTWFSKNFHFEGPMTPAGIRDNLTWLRATIPVSVRLVILNGAEVPSPSRLEPDRHHHHIQYNNVVEDVVRELDNTVISDVRLVVAEASDLTNNIRHYSRRAYFDLASQLAANLAVPGVKRKSRLVIGARQTVLGARGFVLKAGGKILRLVRRVLR